MIIEVFDNKSIYIYIYGMLYKIYMEYIYTYIWNVFYHNTICYLIYNLQNTFLYCIFSVYKFFRQNFY